MKLPKISIFFEVNDLRKSWSIPLEALINIFTETKLCKFNKLL